MKQCNTIEIDDPRITEMDPVRYMWMYNNWIADQNDKAELAKQHAYLLASFWNPEAVQQILGEGNVHESSDAEYEESLRIVREQSLQLISNKEGPVKKRKRRRPTTK